MSRESLLKPWQGKSRQAGFSLLEVMIAGLIAAIGFYSTMYFFQGQGYRKKSQVAHDNLAEFDDFLKTLVWKKVSRYVEQNCDTSVWTGNDYFPTSRRELGSFGYYKFLHQSYPEWGSTPKSASVTAMHQRCAAKSSLAVDSSQSGFYFCVQLTAKTSAQGSVPAWSIYSKLGNGDSEYLAGATDNYPNRAIAEVWVGLRSAAQPSNPVSCNTYYSSAQDKSYFGVLAYTAYYVAAINRNNSGGLRYEDKIRSRMHYLGR